MDKRHTCRSHPRQLDRRTFLKSALAATAIPGLAAGQLNRISANEKVNLAFIGIGGMGSQLVKTFDQIDLVNIVAFCDVDMGSSHTSEIINLHPDVPRFRDFREMFDKKGDEIDAVTIAVPDHSHFPIAMHAMALGKHVYVEKPLANTFEETELLMAAEKKYGVAAQMGNQGHSGPNYFQFKAWSEAGLFKDVTKVTAFMNTPRRWHGWEIDGYPSGEPVPETLAWDLWHTAAEPRPFSSKYHPGNWRSWYRYGNGAFGDWGPHILDTIHRFLDLGLPTNIEAVSIDGPNDFIFPQSSTIRFDFPARGEMPPVEITWYDGVDNKPPAPPELEGRELRDHGKIIYAKDLVFYGGTHGDTVRIVPEEKMREMSPSLPRFSTANSDHYLNFILAAKGEEKCRSSFDVAGPLCQVFCLGAIAQELGGKLEFDRRTKQITNNSLANELLKGPAPRKGWEQYWHAPN